MIEFEEIVEVKLLTPIYQLTYPPTHPPSRTIKKSISKNYMTFSEFKPHFVQYNCVEEPIGPHIRIF